MAKVKIIIKKRKLANGQFPIVLRVIHLTEPALYIRLDGLSTNETEWDATLSRYNPKKKGYKKLNIIISEIEEKADSILQTLSARGEFSYTKFKTEYFGIKEVDDSVLNSYKCKIDSLIALEKFSTAEVYKTSFHSFLTFTKGKDRAFSEINYSFVKQFVESRMLLGNSGNTISIQLRSLRALHYNFCNEAEIAKPTCYEKFQIKSIETKTQKRGLSQIQLKRLYDYAPVNHYEEIAKDIFIFSLLTRGCNLTDMAALTVDNIIDGKINYKRSKTNTPFTVSLSPGIKSIIDKYKPTKYLFPILVGERNNTHTIKLFNRAINERYKIIAKKIDLPPFSFYWARHSWASLARKNKVSIELISAGLGHSELRTTEVYLNSFENEALDDITNVIMNSLY